MRYQALMNLIGEPYEEFDSEGRYLGCFLPMYVLNSKAPRYFLPCFEEEAIQAQFASSKLVDAFIEGDIQDLEFGDILVFKF